jgi:hypothetical protein
VAGLLNEISAQQTSDFGTILFSRTDVEDLALLDIPARAEVVPLHGFGDRKTKRE